MWFIQDPAYAVTKQKYYVAKIYNSTDVNIFLGFQIMM